VEEADEELLIRSDLAIDICAFAADVGKVEDHAVEGGRAVV